MWGPNWQFAGPGFTEHQCAWWWIYCKCLVNMHTCEYAYMYEFVYVRGNVYGDVYNSDSVIIVSQRWSDSLSWYDDVCDYTYILARVHSNRERELLILVVLSNISYGNIAIFCLTMKCIVNNRISIVIAFMLIMMKYVCSLDLSTRVILCIGDSKGPCPP